MKIVNKPKLKHLRKLNRNKPIPWEWKLWQHLKERQIDGHKFRRQVSLNNFIVDFCCLKLKLVIELDGSGHLHSIQRKKDNEKDNELSELGFSIIRFWNNEIDENLNGVLELIADKCRRL